MWRTFGYGSLMWRPSFAYLEARTARLPGFARRFWQGSSDHRGVPQALGRVVTLVHDDARVCNLGPASSEAIVLQIATARGPSGPNDEYLLRLEETLRAIGAEDEHVFELAALLRRR
ncbi:MAG: gamma-glutamylcyclotransferase [Myxococcota bacterium]|nr:gamma-glutamylcyclotransferase [Myxococcota bacterium]